MNLRRAIAVFALPIALAGCGGGGSSATGSEPKLFPLLNNKTTKVTGVGRSYAYTAASPDEANQNVTTTGLTGATAVELEGKTNAAGDVTSMTLKSGSTTILGTKPASPDEDAPMVGFYSSDEKQAVGIADPEKNGFSYQTYGAWETMADNDRSSGKNGAYSVGRQTAAAAVPTSGTATFTGRSETIETDGNETPEFVGSAVTLTADFAKRSVAYNSVTDDAIQSRYNMTGNMTYAAGTNSMAGTYTTAGDARHAPITGTIDGRFYGGGSDAAREVGGTYGGQNGSQTMIGSYGAKQ